MDRWNVTRLVLLNISSKFPWIQRHWASAKLNIPKVYCIAELILHYLAVRRGKFYHELFPTNVFSTSALLSIKRSCSWWNFSKGIPSAKFKGVPGSAIPPISHGSPANYSVRLRRSSRFSSKGPRLVSCIVCRMLVLLAASTFSYMALLNCTLFIAPWSVKPSYPKRRYDMRYNAEEISREVRSCWVYMSTETKQIIDSTGLTRLYWIKSLFFWWRIQTIRTSS